ncbi:MAG: hypothetical protein IPH93_07235 [Saprospiraceae bacterium]|nr:hypothetical protein [Saprospiraceae bacterium]
MRQSLTKIKNDSEVFMYLMILKYLPTSDKLVFSLTLLIFNSVCNAQTKTNPITVPLEQSKSSIVHQTSEFDNVHCGLCDKAGNLWFGTTGAGIYRYDGKTFTNFTTEDGIKSNNIWCVFEDKNGYILFGSDSGILRYNPLAAEISFTNLTENSDLKNTSIWSFCEDKAGKLWIATGDSGVYNYDGKIFRKLLTNDIKNSTNLRFNYISGITEDKTGSIWFASWNNEGLSSFNGKSLIKFSYAENAFDYMVHCIIEDKTGNLWFGTRNDGAFQFDPSAAEKSIINYKEKEGFTSRGISHMLEDKKGNIWFGTENRGVFCYNPSAALSMARFDLLRLRSAQAAQRAQEGSLFTVGKTFTNFTTKDGLSNNSVFSIVEDKAGNIWFGTRNVGLCRYDGKLITDFTDQLKK